MSLRSWITRILGVKKQRPLRKRPAARLVLEALEERTVPAGLDPAFNTSGPIGDQTVFYRQDKFTLNLPGGAHEVNIAGSMAYFLDRDLNLSFTGDYSQNFYKMNEKWLLGKDDQWYFIKPNGQFLKWNSSLGAQGGSLVTTLDPVYHAYPELLHSATAASLNYVLDQRLGLSFAGSIYENHGNRQEKWLLGSGGQWYFIDSLGGFYHWDGRPGANGRLLAQMDPLYWAQPERLALPLAREVDARIVNNVLEIDPVSNWSGWSGRVVVELNTLSPTPGTQKFLVNFVDRAPTLTPVQDQTMLTTTDQFQVSVTVNSNEADGFNLMGRGGHQGYVLDQSLRLSFAGDYYFDSFGVSEKWLLGTHNQWYFIKPGGELVLWDGSRQATGAVAATLDPLYYFYPQLLTNAQEEDMASLVDRWLVLSSSGDLALNFGGQQEKWIQGFDGWYFVKPNGQLWKWDRTPKKATGTLMASLHQDYYTHIERLINAQLARLQVSASGNTLYLNPPNNFVGDFWVMVQASDTSHFVYDTFKLTVAADTNRPPVAVNDAYTLNAGQTLNIASHAGVLVNDQDPDGNSLVAFLGTGPAHGTLTLNANGSFTYQPQPNYTGTDSFTYRAGDGKTQSNLATVNLTVNAAATNPSAAADAFALYKNQTFVLNAAAGNTLSMVSQPGDYIGQGRTYAFSTQTGVFTAERNFQGGVTLHYHDFTQPSTWWDLGFASADNAPLAPGTYSNATRLSFRQPNTPGMEISGEHRGSNTLTGTFTVQEVQYAPDGTVLRFLADFEQHNEGGSSALTGTIDYRHRPTGILLNDQETNQAPLLAKLVTGPANGTLNLQSDGSLTYVPKTNFVGTDSFTYRAGNGSSQSTPATVTFTVTEAPNTAPVAANDSYTVTQGQTLTLATRPNTTSITMVSDPGDYIGQGKTYSFTPGTGTFAASRNFDNGVSINYSGDWGYGFAAPIDGTLVPGIYTGATRFPFQASRAPALSVSGEGRGSNRLTGSFTVTQARYAADGAVLTFVASFEQHSEGATPALRGEVRYNPYWTPSGVLRNDQDVDGDPLSALLLDGPLHGSLTLNGDGSLTYQPEAGFVGTDSFTYKVSDGKTESNVATVVIDVQPGG